ncbi:MAG: hypothetical protein QM820_18670 [Minicystis sp.]
MRPTIDDVSLLSLIAGLAMPELGARREDVLPMTLAKLDEHIATLTDTNRRAAALRVRSVLAAWTSSVPTEEVAEAAQAMLVAEGHGAERDKVRRGIARVEVMAWIHAFAHPESHASSRARAVEAIPKLDAYLALVTEEDKRAAASAMRVALAGWTATEASEAPEAVKLAALAMLVVEDFATFHDHLRDLTGLRSGGAGTGT